MRVEHWKKLDNETFAKIYCVGVVGIARWDILPPSLSLSLSLNRAVQMVLDVPGIQGEAERVHLPGRGGGEGAPHSCPRLPSATPASVEAHRTTELPYQRSPISHQKIALKLDQNDQHTELHQ